MWVGANDPAGLDDEYYFNLQSVDRKEMAEHTICTIPLRQVDQFGYYKFIHRWDHCFIDNEWVQIDYLQLDTCYPGYPHNNILVWIRHDRKESDRHSYPIEVVGV